MTEHHSSEQELFDASSSDSVSIVQQTRKAKKRISFGPRIPIVSPDGKEHRRSMSAEDAGSSSGGNGQGKKVGKQGRGLGGGTVLGFSGFTPSPENALILSKAGEDGKTEEFNVFETVFTGGKVTSVEFEMILNYVYTAGKLDFSEFIDGIVYQGFDRLFYIKAALKKVSVSVFCRFAILGAVRGSNFAKILESCINMPPDLTSLVNSQVVIKKAKRRDDLTILRFTASIPHWVAFWLFTCAIEKKIATEDCPAWLQFPGAASLPMGKKQRLQHISFCKAFSALLPGGSFNGNIYYTAYSNQIPRNDIPSMIKEGLGIGDGDATSGTITGEDVRKEVVMTVARKG